jgi:hypothetical protein
VDVLAAWLFSFDYNDPLFVLLVFVGIVVGSVYGRLRLALCAVIAALVVVWPVSTPTLGYWTVHRLVPACAMQVIAVGVGASWLREALPFGLGRRWGALAPAVGLALLLAARTQDEVRGHNAITDEFWLLRSHLAPNGVVEPECTLLAFGRQMDSDFHDFRQIVPGTHWVRCENQDCAQTRIDSECVYYLRSLNCYNAEKATGRCLDQGSQPEGDRSSCLDPRCARLEGSLALSVVEERTTDLHAAFRNDVWPHFVDIGLYRVELAQ